MILGAGTYTVTESVILQSNVTIQGQGSDTVITFADSVADTIDEPLLLKTRSGDGIENVSILDLHLLCTVDITDLNDRDRTDNAALFIDGVGDESNPASLQNQNINLRNVEVSNCGGTGIHIKGTTGVTAIDVNAHDNGWGTIDLWHNMYLLRVHDVTVIQTSPGAGGYTNSPSGHGLRMSNLDDVYFEGLNINGNADHGLHMNDVSNLRAHNLDIGSNCVDSLGSCSPENCFGSCDANLNAPKE